MEQLGEGGADGRLPPHRSPAFALLEVCLCVLVRYYPDISPRAARSVLAMQARSRAARAGQLSPDQQGLVARAVHILAGLVDLCSPAGTVTLAPTLVYLVTAVLQAGATTGPDHPDHEDVSESAPVVAALEALQRIVSVRYPQVWKLEK